MRRELRTSLSGLVTDRVTSACYACVNDLEHVCRHYFGRARIKGSHHIFKMPWAGDPRINIQNEKGKAKAYQVKQVLQALDKLADEARAAKRAEEKAKEKAEKPRKK